MKIEVLYVAGCPGHPKAVQLVRGILSAEGVSEEVHEVLVRDARMAEELGFPGSPTIRVNGHDVAGESLGPRAFSLCCRLYPGPTPTSLPPAETVERAVRQAQRGTRG